MARGIHSNSNPHRRKVGGNSQSKDDAQSLYRSLKIDTLQLPAKCCSVPGMPNVKTLAKAISHMPPPELQSLKQEMAKITHPDYASKLQPLADLVDEHLIQVDLEPSPPTPRIAMRPIDAPPIHPEKLLTAEPDTFYDLRVEFQEFTMSYLAMRATARISETEIQLTDASEIETSKESLDQSVKSLLSFLDRPDMRHRLLEHLLQESVTALLNYINNKLGPLLSDINREALQRCVPQRREVTDPIEPLEHDGPSGVPDETWITVKEPLFEPIIPPAQLGVPLYTMACLLFPSSHSQEIDGISARETKQHRFVLSEISRGAIGGVDSYISGEEILLCYREFANWAMTDSKFPNDPPIEFFAKAIDLGSRVSLGYLTFEEVAKNLRLGDCPIPIPLAILNHQTYLSMEKNVDGKIILKYYDRQRLDMELGGESIPGYFDKEFVERKSSSELCFEFEPTSVTDDLYQILTENKKASHDDALKHVLNTLKERCRSFEMSSEAPQLGQRKDAFNCTWASFEGFLHRIHGKNFKFEVALYRAYIVDVVTEQHGMHDMSEMMTVIEEGLKKVLKNQSTTPQSAKLYLSALEKCKAARFARVAKLEQRSLEDAASGPDYSN